MHYLLFAIVLLASTNIGKKQTWREAELQLTKEVSQGETTAAGWAWRYESHYVFNLKQLIASCDFCSAKKYYKGMRDTFADNREEVAKLALVGEMGGQTSAELAKRVMQLMKEDYLKDEIVLMNGDKTTVGMALNDQYGYEFEKRNEFRRIGLSRKTADVYFMGDDNERTVIHAVVDPYVQGTKNGGMDVMRKIKLQALIDLTATNAQLMHGLFAESILNVVEYLAKKSKVSDACNLMKKFVTLAQSVSEKESITGVPLLQKTIEEFESAERKTRDSE